ncbi:unnamed protein product [Phaeothamnion confervicola]
MESRVRAPTTNKRPWSERPRWCSMGAEDAASLAEAVAGADEEASMAARTPCSTPATPMATMQGEGGSGGSSRRGVPPSLIATKRARLGLRQAAIERVFNLQDLSAEIFGWQDGRSFASFPAGDVAAANGHVSLLKAKHARGQAPPSAFTEEAFVGAAVSGNVQTLIWLDAHVGVRPLSTRVMDRAIAEGQLDCVKWLHDKRGARCSPHAFDAAAANGHLELMKWARRRGLGACSRVAIDWAAGGGHLESLRWLHATGMGASTNAMDWAAEEGHLEALVWLAANRSEGCTARAMDV